MNYQRHLLLPLQSLLALLIFLSLASAQNPSNTSDFVLSVQETLFLCENAELSWSGSTMLPLYEVFLASGQGPVGDNDSLDAEQWLGAVNDTAFEWFVEPPRANTGNVLRFRVQDDNGKGISVVAWSTVAGSSCTGAETDTQTIIHGPTTHIHHGPTSFIVSIHTTGDVTTKNTNVQTQTADLITITGIAATVTSDISTQGPSAPSPSPENSNQSGPASPTSSPGSNNSSGQDPSQVASGDSSKTDGGMTTNQPQGTRSGQRGSQSTKTAAPVEVNSEDTSSPKGAPLSAQAIGAIAGTVCIATALWLCYVLWRRRLKRRAVAIIPSERESPNTGSTRELLDSASQASPNSLQGRTMATVETYPQTQMLTVPPPPPPASGYAGAMVPSYEEATSPYSPLGTPDPFRNNIPLPGNSRSQLGLS